MQKMRQCALNFLVKTGNKRNRSSSFVIVGGVLFSYEQNVQ